jgi:hypothetical protein
MAVSRRTVLKFTAGSAAALVAAGAGGAWWLNKGPLTAEAPWAIAQSNAYDDPRLRALAWAVLAPNPHNMQPWLIDLVGEDRIDLYFQRDRDLPETDPWDRQLTIGFGCFCELLAMGAAEDGHRAEITPFPDAGHQPKLDAGRMASIRLVEGGAERDPLFPAIPDRRTDRDPYALEPLPAGTGEGLRAALRQPAGFSLIEGEAEVAALRDLAARSFEIEVRTPNTWMESIHVMRIGRAEMDAEPYGLALRGPMIEFARLIGAVSREGLADPTSSGFQQGLDMFLDAISATPAFVSQVTPGNTRLEQFDVGRDWVRLHLAATQMGLTMQPLSQALQEYPEQADPYAEARRRLAPQGGVVQMFGRIGRGRRQPPSPRWPVEARLMDRG